MNDSVNGIEINKLLDKDKKRLRKDSHDINVETIRITPKEQIIGIIPAPVGMSLVYVFNDEGNMVILGFEYPNHEHPDWEETAKQNFDELQDAKQE